MIAPRKDCIRTFRRDLPWTVALGVTFLAAWAAGCSPSPASPTNGAPYSQADIVVGSGTTAANGNLVGVNYTGWLYDASQANQQGAQFDATAPGTPFTFTLGAGQVIQGWDQGVAGMNIGGIRRLVIPPSLGYGDTRHGLIPPNSTLVFQIELVSVQ
jgi:FKBP-type peptidyl-prolyl cis-trans isomerase FkpA